MLIIKRLKTILFYYLRIHPSITEVCPIELHKYRCMITEECYNNMTYQIKSLKERNQNQYSKILELKQQLKNYKDNNDF